MQRGLEGRRVALMATSDAKAQETATAVIAALEAAGAIVQQREHADDEEFHGGKYAAVILAGGTDRDFSTDGRLVQLVREFVASDKPVAALGSGLAVVLDAGGAAGRAVVRFDPLKSELEGAGASLISEPMHSDDALFSATSDADPREVASRIVGQLAERFEDRDVDLMSELSFPASDPPAVTPASVGRVAPDGDAGTADH